MYIYIHIYIYTHIYTYLVHMGMKWLIPQNGWCMDGFQSQKWLVGLWCLLVPPKCGCQKIMGPNSQAHSPNWLLGNPLRPYGPVWVSVLCPHWLVLTSNDGRTTVGRRTHPTWWGVSCAAWSAGGTLRGSLRSQRESGVSCDSKGLSTVFLITRRWWCWEQNPRSSIIWP